MSPLAASFRLPPSPLTPPERKLLWLASAVVAATRLFALATSPWDWDEVQFMAAVREYDVGRHHPHPAGFPLYILLGNLVQLFGLSDFRSLQVVNVVSACALFPLLFLVARELRFSFRTSILAALLFAFFPNIWYFGGTIFSDIFGVAIALCATWMLLRGCRDGLSFLAGCALAGASLAVRPHSGFVLLAPLLVATWHQRHEWKRVVGGAFLTLAVAAGSYAGAALASESVAVYIDRVLFFQQWVHDVDSFANPGRGSLGLLAMDFLLRPMGAGRLSLIVTGLSVIAVGIGVAKRHAGVLVTFGAFAPYMLFAWLMHDPVGFRRYSTAYVALYALLAVYALEVIASMVGRGSAPLHVLMVTLLVVRYVSWAHPALVEVRTTIAPTHAAASRVRRAVPEGGRVWVDDSMPPWASYYLAGRRVVEVDTPAGLPLDAGTAGEYFLTEGLMREDGAEVFVRPRGRVAEIHPPRHFTASVAPLGAVWRFGEGWSDPEGHETLHWRWMAGRSVALIPSRPGRARLALRFEPPRGLTADVEVRLNGVVLGRYPLNGPMEREWVVEALDVNRLEITTSATVSERQAGGRDLGLRLLDYGWRPL